MSFIFAALLMAEAAVAAPAPPPGQPPVIEGQLFIAPSGEPFRAPYGQPYPVVTWFAGADTNHDGKLTSTEFLVDFMRFFDSLDANRDGKLDASEIAHYETDLVPEVRERGGPGRPGSPRGRGGRRGGPPPGGGGPGGGGWSPGSGGSRHFQSMDDGEGQSDDSIGSYRSAPTGNFAPDRPMGGARFDLLAIPEPVTAMGHDLSGVVLRRDALAAASSRFNTLDTEGRGYLTLDGLPESPAQRYKPKKRK